MASTSAQLASDSSSSKLRWTHDVFLSFRGEDTRDNFTDHLYTHLIGRGIITFRDDRLTRGEEIEPELLKAIEKSRSSIVVFSKNYADSRWCLEELAKIMEWRQKFGQIVLPIFYHVVPSDVRNQAGSFGRAFTRYEENWKNKVQRWREALTEAANISGWHVNEGYESEHIKKITSNIVHRIQNRKLLFVEENLVGMDYRMKKVSLGLNMESNDVRVIMIYGIPGIGKTTIAKYVYDQISWGFECSSFLENVGGTSLLVLQNQLLRDIIAGGNKKISNIHQAAYVIENSLYFQKTLIVFDDVDDDMDKLELLVGKQHWFGKGSRIIITTRDKHVQDILEVDHLYEVEGLNPNEALKLFSQYAFRPNFPKEDFESLIDRVIHYCQGLPLALKVLGSNLRGKTIREWESQLHKLEKEPEMKIRSVLKTSYDGLDCSQKRIFLDIACFFKGENKDFASKILEGCKLYGEINIRVLWDRCLISISSNNRVYMHDLIQQMGWNIVREEHPEDPSKWSRLWNSDDIYHAFISEEGMGNVETISLDLSTSNEIWFTREIFSWMKKVFVKMKKLRLLKVYSSHGDEYKMALPNDFEFPRNLRYLHWEGLESLPLNFNAKNLVAINLESSNIKELWASDKCLVELKFLDVSNSQQLMKMPKFSSMPRLERLNLEGCRSICSLGAFHAMKFLTELNLGGTGIKGLPSSIGSLSSLETLSLSGCLKFEKFPEIQGSMKCLSILELEGNAIKELPSSISCLEGLWGLFLGGCSKFEKFPEIEKSTMGSLERLSLDGTAIKKLPDSMVNLEGLKLLNLENCKNLSGLPSSIYGLKNLSELSLNDCSDVEAFPEITVDMEELHDLYASGMAIKELPLSIGRLKNLVNLELINCENLVTIPDSIGNLTRLGHLCVCNCSKLQKLPDSLRSLQCCLRELNLGGCNLMEGAIPSDLWCLSSLRFLDLSENNISRIPAGIIQLPMLDGLCVNHCLMLEEIPDKLPPSLRRIQAHGCPCLEILSSDPTHSLWSSLLNNFKLEVENVRGKGLGWFDSEKIQIMIPGSSGIPEWVSNKGMSCEVRIELSENWYQDDNFLGFALFSLLLPILDDDDDDDDNGDNDEKLKIMDPSFIYELSTSHGDQSKSISGLLRHASCRTYNVGSLVDSYRPNQLHVYHKGGTSDPALDVFYLPQCLLPTECRSRQWKHFKARCDRPYRCGDTTFKVKSCGIHLLYAQPQGENY